MKLSLKIFFIITQLFLIMNEPYAFRWIVPLPDLLVSSIVYFIILCIFLSSWKVNRFLPRSITIIFVITEVTWAFYSIIHSDTSYFTRIVLLFITYLCLLFLYRSETFYDFWRINNRIILIQAFLSTICFFLVAIGLLHPLLSFYVSRDSIIPYHYWGGCFSKTYIGNLIRPSGFFDEPGALASWAIFAVVFNYTFIKDKIISKYLPYLALSTLSVAYIVQMAAFLIIKNLKSIYNLIPIAVLLMLAIPAINMTKDSDFDLYAKTLARFEYNEETGIEGNSRQDHMDNAKVLFQKSPIWGIGGQTFGKLSEASGDNPYEILAKDGIIGFFVSYLPFIMVLFINRRKEVLICFVILALGYQQRPLHINFMHNLYLWSFLLFAFIDARRNIKRKYYEALSKGKEINN